MSDRRLWARKSIWATKRFHGLDTLGLAGHDWISSLPDGIRFLMQWNMVFCLETITVDGAK